ncbi:MAG: type II toxin-antitoxin system Phd/YefM family antitoxin [Deltaproteobacteria bacterium]|nr:type II toxin-antitoxin system Phd/YefM family antitoxin [Deltaproteobacteria bacterium]
MRSRPLADVKAHLSEIVDSVEHRGARLLITRHGKPAAAIVPVGDLTTPQARKVRVRPKATRRAVEAMLASFAPAEPGDSAVEQLRRDRR